MTRFTSSSIAAILAALSLSACAGSCPPGQTCTTTNVSNTAIPLTKDPVYSNVDPNYNPIPQYAATIPQYPTNPMPQYAPVAPQYVNGVPLYNRTWPQYTVVGSQYGAGIYSPDSTTVIVPAAYNQYYHGTSGDDDAVAQSFQQAQLQPLGIIVRWQNQGNSDSGYVVATKDYHNEMGQSCREYTSKVTYYQRTTSVNYMSSCSPLDRRINYVR